MLDSEPLLVSMQHETDIIKHLAGRLSPEQLAYRPTAGQRSMLELLQYLTYSARSPVQALLNGNWDHHAALQAEAADVTPETFAGAMDRQMVRLRELVADLGPDDLARAGTLPWGDPTTVGAGLVDMGLKTFVAYRMQLFLWAKASGCEELSSYDCWVGRKRAE